MDRRHFVKTTATAASAAVASVATASAAVAAGAKTESPSTGVSTTAEGAPFQLNYAPHPGMFKASAGKDVIDQIKFSHEAGFRSWEFNGLPKEAEETQQFVGDTLKKLDMTMGVFVAHANFDRPTFVNGTKTDQAKILADVKASVDVAKRCGAKWMTVVPGSVDQQHGGPADGAAKDGAYDQWNKYGGSRLSEGYQTANAIQMLRRCAEILEAEDLVMVLEPLNWHANHGGTFLQQSDQAYAICKAVNSPSCKILFDIYHQQITEGNLISNIDLCWDEIAYFQAGDNPGRKEPGTGEINYRNVFKHIHSKGFEGVIGMEHGNSMKGVEGEQAVIQAYRDADSF